MNGEIIFQDSLAVSLKSHTEEIICDLRQSDLRVLVKDKNIYISIKGNNIILYVDDKSPSLVIRLGGDEKDYIYKIEVDASSSDIGYPWWNKKDNVANKLLLDLKYWTSSYLTKTKELRKNGAYDSQSPIMRSEDGYCKLCNKSIAKNSTYVYLDTRIMVYKGLYLPSVTRNKNFSHLLVHPNCASQARDDMIQWNYEMYQLAKAQGKIIKLSIDYINPEWENWTDNQAAKNASLCVMSNLILSYLNTLSTIIIVNSGYHISYSNLKSKKSKTKDTDELIIKAAHLIIADKLPDVKKMIKTLVPLRDIAVHGGNNLLTELNTGGFDDSYQVFIFFEDEVVKYISNLSGI